MCDTTSPFVPAHVDHDVVAASASAPEDAALKPMALRVVTEEAFDVPALPGSPVWSFTASTAGAVNDDPLLLPRIEFAQAFARLVVERPTVMLTPQ
jgi:hypothetical protein